MCPASTGRRSLRSPRRGSRDRFPRPLSQKEVRWGERSLSSAGEARPVISTEYGVSLVFRFTPSVKGIGGFTENRARVSSASLHMPREQAEAIAEALAQCLASDGRQEVILTFGLEEQPEE